MPGRCAGKIALVTGAGRGIGRAIAEGLAREGADVIVNDLPPSQPGELSAAEQTAAELRALGRRAWAWHADVGDRQQVEAMFAEAVKEAGRLDIAVANAATNVKQPIAETDWPSARRIIDVTLLGLFHTCQLAAQQMIAQFRQGQAGGRILMTGSVHADMAIGQHGIYAMCKAAGNQLCRSLARELLPYRINVNAVNPGWTDTPGERQFLTEEQLQANARRLPWGRLARAEEVAELFVLLASEAGQYMTGSILTIDGGVRLDPSVITEGL